jgi:predicted CopG family antitoxin
VYITLDAYRHILKEKERLNCSVSDAIVRIIQEQEKLSETQEQNGHATSTQTQTQTQVAEASQ